MTEQKERPFTVIYNGRSETELDSLIPKMGEYMDWYTGQHENQTTFVVTAKEDNPYLDSGLSQKGYPIHYKFLDRYTDLVDEGSKAGKDSECVIDAFFGCLYANRLERMKEFNGASPSKREQIDQEVCEKAYNQTLDYILFDDFKGDMSERVNVQFVDSISK